MFGGGCRKFTLYLFWGFSFHIGEVHFELHEAMMIFQKNHQNCLITVEVYTNGHANSDGLQNMQATSLRHLFFTCDIILAKSEPLRL